MSLVFRRVAESEFRHAAGWYEAQRPGLGIAFVNEVQLALNLISVHPQQNPIVDGDIRAAMVNRFPYCIYYRIKPDRVTVIAVFHTSRDPLHWRKRK